MSEEAMVWLIILIGWSSLLVIGCVVCDWLEKRLDYGGDSSNQTNPVPEPEGAKQ